MAGGTGKSENNVIVLRPQQQITLDKNHKEPEKETRMIKFMGSLEEDPHIKFLALQYRAYLERRKLLVFETSLEYTMPPTFADYIEIRTKKE